MLCNVCYGMLHAQKGRRWQGSFDVVFNHHKNEGMLQRSADMSCLICSRLYEEWKKQVSYTQAVTLGRQDNFITAYLTLQHNDKITSPEQGFAQSNRSIQAMQKDMMEARGMRLYRLAFMISSGAASTQRCIGTFLLQQISEGPDKERNYVYTPRSDRLNKVEVLELARYWLADCLLKHEKCSEEPEDDSSRQQNGKASRLGIKSVLKPKARSPSRPVFYPTRLIDIRKGHKLDRDANREDLVYLTIMAETDELQVADETDDDEETPQAYVTLSHCWGSDTGSRRFELRQSNLDTYQNQGIRTSRLPRTFRDAIDFARKLDKRIRYIWIDSLCIIQQDGKDWVHESVQMHKVYGNALVNISATAAPNSDFGLYLETKPRDPSLLWGGGETVEFNVQDIYTIHHGGKLQDRARGTRLQGQPVVQSVSGQGQIGSPMHRCLIIDPSFWNRKVEDAPVNKRGWVLQERLLAPRVIHFCEDQIAWQCCESDAAEYAPHGIPEFESDGDRIKHRIRLKEWMRPNLKRGGNEISQWNALERWIDIVQLYSKTALTMYSDRLVALAGIAHVMETQICSKYVAGLWERFLASQLLWHVQSQYEHGRFFYESKRLWGPVGGHQDDSDRAQYCAPTFSWAAINAPSGIACGTIQRDGELLIRVQKIEVEPKEEASPFGPLGSHGRVQLSCQLQNVSIVEKRRRTRDGHLLEMYTWKLKGDKEHRPGVSRLRPIVYLDSPLHDLADIRGGRSNVFGDVYFVPAFKSPERGLVGLLLQEQREARVNRAFRRIGLSCLPTYSPALSTFADEDGSIQHVPRVDIWLY